MNIKESNKYQFLRKNILNVILYSTIDPYWYDSNQNLIPWSDSITLLPADNLVVYNISDKFIPVGYYKWSGTTVSTISSGDTGCDVNIDLFQWVPVDQGMAYEDFYLPIWLEAKVDEMGVMVGFDGQMEQVEQICNFSYTQTGNTVQVYNTVDTSKVSELFFVEFVVDWGDGSPTTILSTSIISATHTYSVSSGYTVSIILETPWTHFTTSKFITVPSNTTVVNPLGTLTGFTIPYTNITGSSMNYLYDLDYNSTGTTPTTFYYASMGRSRIDEKKLYGSDTYSGVTTGITVDGNPYSAYTIDNLYYQDFDSGITTITGATSGFTKEEVFNNLITRNEHFIGFIDEPQIYSDLFVQRGKQGVLEKTFRLSEIGNTGELDIYGNGYFNIKKQ